MKIINKNNKTNFRVVEDASPVIGSYNCKSPIETKVGSSDEFRGSRHFVPQGHFFVGNIPQS